MTRNKKTCLRSCVCGEGIWYYYFGEKMWCDEELTDEDPIPHYREHSIMLRIKFHFNQPDSHFLLRWLVWLDWLKKKWGKNWQVECSRQCVLHNDGDNRGSAGFFWRRIYSIHDMMTLLVYSFLWFGWWKWKIFAIWKACWEFVVV